MCDKCKNGNYVAYHVHSFESNPSSSLSADSVTNYTDYFDKAVEYGMKAISISEHGSLTSWYKKMNEARARGLKYIIGMEAYITFDNEKTKKLNRDNHHFGLYAKNDEGRKELLKLSSKSYEKDGLHFFYNPRITFNELKNTSDNIIMTTACLGSFLWQYYKKVNYDKNEDAQIVLDDIIGFLTENKHRTFLELQFHEEYEQKEYNRFLLKLSKKTGIPIIAGSDSHSLNKEHQEARTVLLKSQNATYGNEDSFDLTFKPYGEFRGMFVKQDVLNEEEIDIAIENTNVFADMFEDYVIDTSHKYPRLYDNPVKLFTEEIQKGYKIRGIDKFSEEKQAIYKKRINEEFAVYKKMDAIDFMLLQKYEVNDWCKANGIAVGFGRGSVSGSLIAYLLGITEMDSIKHKLSFGRFMNENRISLADIDTDIDSERRHELIKHIAEVSKEKGIYFSEIITFNTMALKQGILDAGRGLGMDLKLCSEISKSIDEKSEDKTVENRYREQYPDLFKYADIFNGVVKSVGSHPSGFVVSPIPLDDSVGTLYTKESLYPVSILNMKDIDKQNFVKLDLLGLINVTIIDKACKMLGIPFLTPETIDDEDMDVWKSMREDTMGVFQMESDSAQAYLKLLFRDSTIEKLKEGAPEIKMMNLLSIANGAIRPSGASYRYDLSSGITKSYGHEALDKMMAETGSYMVFQETINRFLVEFCGFSESDADSTRRGIAKKEGTEQFIPAITEGFIKEMTETYGDEESHAKEILEGFLQVINDASDYAFSLNHSQSYSYLGYICAYLKYHHPVEFLTAMLNVTSSSKSASSKKKKTAKIMNLAKIKDVTIRPIKYGRSGAYYRPDAKNNAIYKGLESISNISASVADQLLDLSNTINYDNFIDLLVAITEKTKTNSSQLEILIRLDYFKEFGEKELLFKTYSFFNNHYSKNHVESTKIVRLDWIRKMYRIFSCQPIIKETIEDRMEYERDKLGYPMAVFPEIDERIYYVTEIDKQYTPKIFLYQLSTGKELMMKMKKGAYYIRNNANSLYEDGVAILQGDTIVIGRTMEDFKVKPVGDGEFVKTEEKESFIQTYKVIRPSKNRKLAE